MRAVSGSAVVARRSLRAGQVVMRQDRTRRSGTLSGRAAMSASTPMSRPRAITSRRRAPSSGNWQPWNFVLMTDCEQLIELAKVWDPGGRNIARSAATIALVTMEPDDVRHRD